MTQHTVDINCDMGESYGAWTMGNDAAVMPLITSANIACGFHGGDPATIRKTIALATEAKVAVGAHPSLPDLMGFGRRTMHITAQEMYDLVLYQAGAVAAFARAAGVPLHVIKELGRWKSEAYMIYITLSVDVLDSHVRKAQAQALVLEERK